MLAGFFVEHCQVIAEELRSEVCTSDVGCSSQQHPQLINRLIEHLKNNMAITQKLTALFALVALAVAGLGFTASTAAADGNRHHRSSDDVRVSNSNSAFVVNHTEASASTGGNYASGAEGGDAGKGGDIENDGKNQNVNGSDAGNGGDGGDADSGGTVKTGDAAAVAVTTNVVNKNDTDVDSCGCEDELVVGEGSQVIIEEDDNHGDVTVRNRNHAVLFNGTEARAKTGYNGASGAEGGDGEDGGDIENEGQNGNQNVNDSNAGDGGNGGDATGETAGGWVETGAATSFARTLNVVNKNITRVRR